MFMYFFKVGCLGVGLQLQFCFGIVRSSGVACFWNAVLAQLLFRRVSCTPKPYSPVLLGRLWFGTHENAKTWYYFPSCGADDGTALNGKRDRSWRRRMCRVYVWVYVICIIYFCAFFPRVISSLSFNNVLL